MLKGKGQKDGQMITIKNNFQIIIEKIKIWHAAVSVLVGKVIIMNQLIAFCCHSDDKIIS